MSAVELLVALAVAVGIVGIVVPVLPGTFLVAGALLAWAWTTGGTTAWVAFAIAAVVLLAGAVVKYVVPGRQLRTSGVPTSTLAAGAVLGIVGFFVVPVVGIVLGFVLGVFLAEVRRVGARAARGTTVAALRAIGVSILVELAAAVLAATVWVVGLFLT